MTRHGRLVVAAGQFAALIKAIRGHVTYVNIHSSLWTGGEIRGVLRDNKHGEHDN